MNPGGYQYQSGYQSAAAAGSADASRSNEFEPLAQMIGSNIQKISQNVNQIQKMVNQMGTPQDSEALRSQLHSVHQYTNQLAKDTNVNLKKLAQVYQSSPAMQKREQKLMKERLYNEFMTALQNLQTTQREAATKEKESVMRARAHSGITGNPFENGGATDSTSDHNLLDLASPTTQTQSQVTLQMEEEVNLELLREREQAVRQIESTIRDVNQIFKDLASIVHDQGDVIDSIEANVETATVQVGQGTQQIIKARNYQTKARRKKICLMVFCVVVLLTVILVSVLLAKKD